MSALSMREVKDAIRTYILKTYLPGESSQNLRDDTPLLSSGILDSLAALNLASFVEQQFGIELDVYDTSPERFDRIDDIARTVARKLPAVPGGPSIS
jgi:acyl carrier protein